jgi:phenylpropionate dioxygenase-like ring-hydroxylating dioxygenase large terminal subunit
MTTAGENELLTRIGPGTPMGALMREYWMPVARSDEIAPGGSPLRLAAMGERLVAFRDGAGRIGVIDHRCPHRAASLFYGRNEDGGLRCIYHGWKFGLDGRCTDMPNLPPDQEFRAKVKVRAYPAIDRYGAVWLYMGARGTPPPLPDFELSDVPGDEINVRMVQHEYNWLQGLENDLDTSHFGFLHLGGLAPGELDDSDMFRFLITDRAPRFLVEATPAGLMYAAYRPAGDGRTYWRLGQYMVPFFVIPPAGPLAGLVQLKGYVPMDDTHTMVVTIARKGRALGPRKYKDGRIVPGLGWAPDFGITHLENTTGWFGRWRLPNNAANDWLIDREAQREGTVYSGISGIQVQDAAIAGTMGEIADRTVEQLAPSDVMIARTRRKLIELVRDFERRGSQVLPGVDDPAAWRGHRGGDFIAPEETPFRDAYGALIRECTGAEPRWE